MPAARPGEGRDRVLDGAKAFALGVVVLGHAMAWDLGSGLPASVLDGRPELVWVTWVVQVLPLFFVAGGAADLGSWRRRPEPDAFWRRRILRLGAPVLVYTAVWTALLLPLSAAGVAGAEIVGRFLAGLAWFVGVYAAVLVAVPWTARWVGRPVVTLGVWLGAVAVVDVVRFTVAPAVGWVNVLLVWGLVHQVGYHLAELRRRPPRQLLALALVPAGLAVVLAVPGPYAPALVTYATDATSNFTPPTLVLALWGMAQALVLAAVAPRLARVLARDRVWRVVGPAAERALVVYLWHIPWVGAVAGLAWLAGFAAPTFAGAWWLVHVIGAVVVVSGAWVTAGLGGRLGLGLVALADAGPRRRPAALPAAVAVCAAMLLATVTGYGTWWGPAFLGLPSSSLLTVAVLAAGLWALGAGPGRDQPAHGAGGRAGPASARGQADDDGGAGRR